MGGKQKFKIAVDAAMTLGLLAVMGYQFLGDVAHEWVGAGMFALFILHHVLNWNWWKSLFRGRYTALRTVTVIVDALVLLGMLGLMVSGVILSQHVFDFLPISGGASFARLLHMVSGYWGLVLMSLHLGLHWGIFLGLGRRIGGLKAPSMARTVVLNVLGAAAAVYGLVAFLRRGFLDYMLLRTQFVFLDFEEPWPLYYLDILAMMALFIFLAHQASKLARPRKKKGERL